LNGGADGGKKVFLPPEVLRIYRRVKSHHNFSRMEFHASLRPRLMAALNGDWDHGNTGFQCQVEWPFLERQESAIG
jgi:hypothetical protein